MTELLQWQFPLLILLCSLMIGLIIGSFLNVVILRLPIMLEREWSGQARKILNLEEQGVTDQSTFNLMFPGSHCPVCKANIKPWQNIPVISYFLLHRKCANCGISIPARYPVIELATGLLTVVVILVLGLNVAGIAGCFLTWVLITLAVIDHDTQLLPDEITLPILWLGLSLNLFTTFVDFESAFIGACAGYLTLWIVYRIFKLITGKEGMGYGDFKLLALLGAWLGWQLLPLIILLSSFLGIAIAGILIALGRDRSEPISFGPCLAIAGCVALLWGNRIVLWFSDMTAGTG